MHALRVPGAPLLGNAVEVANGRVSVRRPNALMSDRLDALTWDAVFGQGQVRDHARWLIWEIGQAVGVRPASIHDLYLARGRGEVGGFTVPAINIRGMTYDTARAIFRAARRIETGAFIIEIARAEIADTAQRPAEYVAVVLGAALREGFRGPVFIQGDHFQVNPRKFATDAPGEVAALKQLAFEAVTAGFYNIDVDSSTLVDATRPSLDEQQRRNYETTADILCYLRQIEPSRVTIAVGGDIGQAGGHNSTVAELRAFMNGLSRMLGSHAPASAAGLSKISVQTGVRHGGVVRPHGSIGDGQLDLPALGELSRAAREEYGLAGAVQHGVSELPMHALDHFPPLETAEIHLATHFQDILFELMPAELRSRIDHWLDTTAPQERVPGESNEQIYHRARKKALGVFKREMWDLADADRERYGSVFEETFALLFTQLGVGGTAEVVARYVESGEQHRRLPDSSAVRHPAADDPDTGE